ncbi:hypothetical protein QOT17_023188 [Balamuthia mandrillaris]
MRTESIQFEVEVAASAETIWKVVGDFTEVPWLVALGFKIVDGLDSSSTPYRLKFTFVPASAATPYHNWAGEISIEPLGSSCRTVWVSTFEVDEAKEREVTSFITAIMKNGLTGLKRMVETQEE